MYKPLILILLLLVGFSLLTADVKTCVPVVKIVNDQNSQLIVGDGAGGAIVAWQDARSTGDFNIWAQRFDSMGTMLWTINGKVVCNSLNEQGQLSIVSDGSGGAIIAWQDMRNGNYDIYAQKIDSMGNPVWLLNGIPICVDASVQSPPKLAADNSGGAYIVWSDDRGGDYDIFAVRVDAAGFLYGLANGSPLQIDANNQVNPEICPDGASGAILAYEQYVTDVNAGKDIYAQRIDFNCSIMWSGGGVPACIAAYNQVNPKLVNDGLGSAIIVWEDFVNGAQFNIYVQRVFSDAIQWTANGICLRYAAYTSLNPSITYGGTNSAIIVWQDNITTDFDIYAQKVTGTTTGTLVWNTGIPVTVCDIVGDQLYPQVVSDGFDGGHIVWQDGRNLLTNGFDIYGNHLDAAGGFIGEGVSNGFGICTWQVGEVPMDQTYPVLTNNIDSKALYAWMDRRNELLTQSDRDIYTLGVESPTLPVELSSFTAVATAQLFVSLQWVTESETNNLGFNVFRSNDGLIATATKVNFGIINGTNTSSTHTYSFVDSEVDPETTYYYWLEMVAFDGTSSFSGSVIVNTHNQAPVIPNATVLGNAYPNPFNARTSTNIAMDVKAGETATLTIYNVLGQKVITYVRQAGSYTITWNGRDENGDACSSGIYFYKLSSPSINSTKKMVIVK